MTGATRKTRDALSNARLLTRLRQARYGSRRLLHAAWIACDRIDAGKLDAEVVDGILAARRRAWLEEQEEEHIRIMARPELTWSQIDQLKGRR